MAHAPDLLVLGRIATLADDAGPAWADGVAIGGGRVLAAGSAAEIESLAAPGTRIHRLAPDEVALPGLTDSHLHLVEAAMLRRRVDLEGTRSIEALVDRVHDGWR